VKAWIDKENRALVEVSIASHTKANRESIDAWIDTAFDGHLVMPKSEIERLGLRVLADTDAILADGITTRLRCFYCVVDWMDQTIPIQVVKNVGNLSLIGTSLLAMLDFRINYRDRVCTLSRRTNYRGHRRRRRPRYKKLAAHRRQLRCSILFPLSVSIQKLFERPIGFVHWGLDFGPRVSSYQFLS
jgi:clan AA aspartic protease